MKKDNYFFNVNILLLLIVLIGFSPTFFLRSLSEQEPLPFYLIVHGISCTAWFVVIVIQSYLVKKERIVQHKVYGKYFSLIAPILVISGYAVLIYSTGKYHMQFPPSYFRNRNRRRKNVYCINNRWRFYTIDSVYDICISWLSIQVKWKFP